MIDCEIRDHFFLNMDTHQLQLFPINFPRPPIPPSQTSPTPNVSENEEEYNDKVHWIVGIVVTLLFVCCFVVVICYQQRRGREPSSHKSYIH